MVSSRESSQKSLGQIDEHSTLHAAQCIVIPTNGPKKSR